jgi:hypothetical protein
MMNKVCTDNSGPGYRILEYRIIVSEWRRDWPDEARNRGNAAVLIPAGENWQMKLFLSASSPEEAFYSICVIERRKAGNQT